MKQGYIYDPKDRHDFVGDACMWCGAITNALREMPCPGKKAKVTPSPAEGASSSSEAPPITELDRSLMFARGIIMHGGYDEQTRGAVIGTIESARLFIATQDDLISSLRAEADNWKSAALDGAKEYAQDVDALCKAAGVENIQQIGPLVSAIQARCEKMREALELIAAPKRPDGTYNRDREACEELARAALAEEAKGER